MPPLIIDMTCVINSDSDSLIRRWNINMPDNDS